MTAPDGFFAPRRCPVETGGARFLRRGGGPGESGPQPPQDAPRPHHDYLSRRRILRILPVTGKELSGWVARRLQGCLALNHHPPQAGPVLVPTVDRQGHSRIGLDIAKPLQTPASLGLVVDCDDDITPAQGKAHRHTVRPAFPSYGGEKSAPGFIEDAARRNGKVFDALRRTAGHGVKGNDI